MSFSIKSTDRDVFTSSALSNRPSTAVTSLPVKTGQLNRPISANSNTSSNRITLTPLNHQSVFSMKQNEVIAEKVNIFVKIHSLPRSLPPLEENSNQAPLHFTGKQFVSRKIMLEPLPAKSKTSTSLMEKAKEKADDFVTNHKLGNHELPKSAEETSDEEYPDDFIPLDDNADSISIPTSKSSDPDTVDSTTIIISPPQEQSSSITKGITAPFGQKLGEITQSYNSQRLASSLSEELHSRSLELPFKTNVKNPTLSLAESLDQSFIDHISNLSEDDDPFKPKDGNNGTTRILDGIVVKAEDLDALKRQANMSKILDHYKMKTPETHLLGKSALNALTTSVPDFKVKIEGESSEPVGAIVMTRVKGMNFGQILSEEIENRKSPHLNKENTIFNTFCSQIDRRMQELGHLAALDMLMGNTDRLVKTRYSSEKTEGQLQGEPMINVGNWMYTIDEGLGVKTPSHLGAMVPIDNSCFDFPYMDTEDLEKSKKTHVDSFLNLMKQPQKVAEHILEGFKFNLFEEYHLDLKNPENVFGAGVTLERLQANLEKGLKLGIESIKSSKGDSKFFDQIMSSTNVSDQDHLIYSTIQARATGLKSL